MKFNRSINVNGIVVINGVDVNISFSYENGTTPTSVTFSTITSYEERDSNIYGSCGLTGIINYNVNNGIATDEFLKLVEDECIRILTNYETV